MNSNRVIDICVGYDHPIWCMSEPSMGISYILKCKLNTRNMHGNICTGILMVVCSQQKLACMWLVCSKNYQFNLHDVQLALHKKDKNKGNENNFHQNQ